MLAKTLPLAGLVALSFSACSAPRVDGPAIAQAVTESDPTAQNLEGLARGYPEMRDLQGGTLAKGEFSQWVDGDRVHVRARYDFGPDRWVEEQSVMQQQPMLVHERWSWVEMRGGQVFRKFEVDFRTGNSVAEKQEGGELHRWSEHLDIQPGRAFSGGGWPVAIRWYRDRLLRGETIRLQAVAFTPQPRTATVEITHDGLDRVPMSDRAPIGDRYRIHPKIPWIAKPFVDAPDSLIWLTNEPPAAFLRWEGALMEPDDPIIRVDLLPGGTSGAAIPVKP